MRRFLPLVAASVLSCQPTAPRPKPVRAPVTPSPVAATPPSPAAPVTKVGSFTVAPFDLANDAPPRRPLVPPPAAIASSSVDDAEDEVKLQDVLIGTAPTPMEPKLIDTDHASLKDGVQLVIDSPYQIFAKAGSYVHVAAFLAGFAPAASARVFVDGVYRGRTDANGTIVFRDVPAPEGGSGQRHVAVIAGSGTARVKGGAHYRAYPRTQSFERANLYVYTDRGVFAPGEVVHVRAFAWRLRGDYRPYRKGAIDVLVRKSGKILTGGRVLTDDFGVATLDLPLPATTPEGSYELAVEHLGERATARLQVKRIVSPAVRIEHTLPRFLSRDANALPFAVKLASATGGTFEGGMITLRALDPKGAVVATESRTVKGNGPHAFTLTGATLDKMRKGFVDEQLAAVVIEVVDGATGRRDELRRDLRIASIPYRLVVETDRTEHVPGEVIKILVRATDLEGAPAAGHEVVVKMTGSGQDQKVGGTTDAKGLAHLQLTMPNGSGVNLEASLVKTPSVRGYAFVSRSAPRAMHAQTKVATVEERADTPIEVRFPSQWVPTEKVVHGDVVDSSGSVVQAFLLPVSKDANGWVAKGAFPAPSWGSMLLVFFALGKDNGPGGNGQIGLLTDGASLPVQASRTIAVTLDAKPKAAPGDKITVGIGFKGTRPTQLGVAIVDDGVLALLDPLERTPEQVLYNPERKVLAGTGSQILTWPVVQKTWGYPTYDIALPPFGFRAGGAPLAAVPWVPPYKPPPTTNAPTTKPPASTGATANGPDTDHDGIPDAEDKCPNDPETYNGYEDTDGCPDKGKVIIQQSKVDVAPAAPPPPPAASAAAKSAPSPMEPAPASAAAPSAVVASPPPKVTISIRTDFSQTSLWIPSLVVAPDKGNGKTTVEAKLPDTVGTQRVTVVASDDRGGLGLATAKIVVDQDVSVRSDLPAALVQGDELEVSVAVLNRRDQPVTGEVTLSAPFVSGATKQKVTVPAKGAAAAKFLVRPSAPGSIAYSATFAETGGTRSDTEKRTLWVAPRGAPKTSTFEGKLEAGKPLSFAVERTADDAWVEADLSIAFPSAIPLLEGLEDLVTGDVHLGVEPDASRLLSAIAIEGYLVRTKAKPEAIARVHDVLLRGASDLLLAQHPNGGWGWRWDGWLASQGAGPGTSAYVTTHALLALAKLRETNVPVPVSAIAAGRSYLLSALDANGDVDVSNVAFWEGDGEARKRAATMAAFHAVAATEKSSSPYGLDAQRIGRLRDKAIAIANGGPGVEDPLTLSAALTGLTLHARATKDASPATRDAIAAGIPRLLSLYRTGYWEPSWFHAWGGRVEATRGVVEALTTLSPGGYEAELHDAVAWLLATRPSWGAWHNAWGTAAAIEALALLDPTPPEKANAKVSVQVDGKVVKTLVIDPADPFVSAASLRHVDLPMTAGKHEVRIVYDGALSVPATLTVRRFVPKPESLQLKIERLLLGSTALGKSSSIEVKVTSATARPEAIVRVPLGSGLAPDAKALDALVAKGTIAGWKRDGDALGLSLVKLASGTTTVSLPVVADRKGSFVLPGASIFVPRSPDEAWSAEAKVVVQ